ncbi:hypothetical protein ACK3SF_04970 [Candidatus Nanosalina sp. VS9-1]|uniref:hypothetical protein n=1 Tax=Candidatus Nanosalina sp. VS9-1 TaxID=3388566 RepID=UPI0039E1CF0A
MFEIMGQASSIKQELSSRQKKFLYIEVASILALLVMFYLFFYTGERSLGPLFIFASMALALIPIDTYAYYKGFRRTAVLSLVSAFIAPVFSLLLIILSPGGTEAAFLYLFLFLAMVLVSVVIGYLAPVAVLLHYYITERR